MWLLVITFYLIFVTQVLCDPQLSPSYFVIDQPAKGDKWVNDQTNYATWTNGLLQNIDVFDVELTRLSTDGIIYVAKNVPIEASTLPIHLQGIPPGDDYFLIFINSTHGLMYSLSSRFTILPAGSSGSSSNPPGGKITLETVTVTGPSNPTGTFAHTFAAISGASIISGFVAAVAGALIATTLLLL